jgi:hypothetical protein
MAAALSRFPHFQGAHHRPSEGLRDSTLPVELHFFALEFPSNLVVFCHDVSHRRGASNAISACYANFNNEGRVPSA